MQRLIAILMATMVLGAYAYDSERLMSQVCPNRNYAELSAAITDAGTNTVAFRFDGGEYAITNSLTIPSNITVRVAPGSTFAISSGKVLTFGGGPLFADATTVFTGAGTATGSVQTIYRWPQWGSTTMFNVGSGITGAGGSAVLTSQDNTYSAGTLQALQALSSTNFTLGSESPIDSWDDIRSIVISNTTFAGLPAIALTTNMITTDHVASGASVAVTNATFVNAFDGATNTYTSVGKLNTAQGSGTYSFDLGSHYQGILYVAATVDPGSDYQASMTAYALDDAPSFSSSMPNAGGWLTANYAGRAVAGANFGNHTATETYRITLAIPFVGRYLCISVYDADGTVTHTYKFSQIKAWGIQI